MKADPCGSGSTALVGKRINTARLNSTSWTGPIGTRVQFVHRQTSERECVEKNQFSIIFFMLILTVKEFSSLKLGTFMPIILYFEDLKKLSF